jgi:hypothetical protein
MRRADNGALEDRGPNLVAWPYRSLSVQEAPTLSRAAVEAHLLGRKVYRRTRYLLLRRGEGFLLAEVEHRGRELFEPVERVTILAGPDEIAFVRDPDVDTGIASQLAAAARRAGGGARVVVVEGRYQHVNFIANLAPVALRVVEVVPPEPPKLLAMVEQAIAFDEELPPFDVRFEPIDLVRIAREQPAEHLLFPCRSAGLELDVPVSFLDAGPERLAPWTLIGCARSLEIHRALYGEDPAAHVDFCPAVVASPCAEPTVLKCCLRERGVERREGGALVPWGATLEEVRTALRMLAGLPSAVPEAVA